MMFAAGGGGWLVGRGGCVSIQSVVYKSQVKTTFGPTENVEVNVLIITRRSVG